MRVPSLSLALMLFVGACQARFPTTTPRMVEPLATDDVARVCGLHHEPLAVGVAPLQYGYRLVDTRYQAASRAGFPEAHSTIDSRSCLGTLNTHRRVRFCHRCREAERRWREAQGRT